ncbi:MAG: ribosome silencing factor [Archangium sp.]|nr:ribosome silencing factor [Archangium sp.]
MAAKKKTPAKKKPVSSRVERPAFKKKPAQKASPGKSSSKPSGKKSSSKKLTAKPAKAGKTAKKGTKRPPARTSKRPSPRRKVAPKKGTQKPAKTKILEAPEALALARSIAAVAAEKKAEHIIIIDVRARSSAVGYDYLVIASGESDRQLSAMHEGVDDLLRPQGKRAAVVEASADWVCVTYDEGVMAHFFTPDRREQTDLEGIWSDAPRVNP